MYLINYNINDELKILRFSINPFTFINPYIKSGEEIIELLRFLQEEARKDKECYNMIYPWEELTGESSPNSEYIIVYNMRRNHIQGWCNIKYSKINSSNESIYTCFIKELVVRAKPQIRKIGTMILEFIKDECFSNYIYYKDIENEIKIKTDILYLYAITTSIGFYNTTYLTNLGDIYPEDEIYKHVFIYLQDIDNRKKINKYKRFKENLQILHEFEVNSIMDDESIRKYKGYIAPDRCNKDNKIEEIYDRMLKTDKTIKSSIKSLSSNRKKIKIIRSYRR